MFIYFFSLYNFILKTLIKTKLIDPTHVEVRDYELGQDLRIIHCTDIDYKNHDHIDEPFMFLRVSDQKKGHVINTQQSKFPPYSYYKIYKFLWKPVKHNLDKPVGSVAEAFAKSDYVKKPDWKKLGEMLHS